MVWGWDEVGMRIDDPRGVLSQPVIPAQPLQNSVSATAEDVTLVAVARYELEAMSDASLAVRRADPRDALELFGLMRAFAVYARHEHRLITTPEQLADDLTAGKCRALLALRGERAVG